MGRCLCGWRSGKLMCPRYKNWGGSIRYYGENIWMGLMILDDLFHCYDELIRLSFPEFWETNQILSAVYLNWLELVIPTSRVCCSLSWICNMQVTYPFVRNLVVRISQFVSIWETRVFVRKTRLPLNLRFPGTLSKRSTRFTWTTSPMPRMG